eukprot:7246200-Pyramimonas_sp.AAC.1
MTCLLRFELRYVLTGCLEKRGGSSINQGIDILDSWAQTTIAMDPLPLHESRPLQQHLVQRRDLANENNHTTAYGESVPTTSAGPTVARVPAPKASVLLVYQSLCDD